MFYLYTSSENLHLISKFFQELSHTDIMGIVLYNYANFVSLPKNIECNIWIHT